jgi:quinolinate synthase
MGIPLDQMPLWDPRQEPLGGNPAEAIRRSRVILWRGHCSVHQMFLPQHVVAFRQKYPGIKI